MTRRELLGSCAAGLAATAPHSLSAAQARRSVVIDAHAHAGYLGVYGQKEVPFEQALRAADEAGIDKLCVSSLEAIALDMRQGNQAVYELMKRYPDRVIGFATLPSPHFGRKALDEIERAVKVYGMKGVGELISHASDPLDISRWIAILEKAADLKVPVLAHAAAAACARAAARVPEVTILLAHLGTGLGLGLDDWIQSVDFVKPHPNLLLETCTSITCAGQIELAVRELGADRVVFGTDLPLLDPDVQKAKITSAEISPEARQKILGQNLARILRLPAVA